MTTSGTSTFNLNRNQIILSALRKIKAIASGEVPDAQTVQDCSDQLNTLMKSLEATGLHLWTEAEAGLFLQPGQNAYYFGAINPITGLTDHAAEVYAPTTLLTAAASGASAVTVASAGSILTTYNIGIVLDSGSIFWTTVNGVAGTTVTLLAPTTGSAAAGNQVYTYQNNIVRPLRIVSARRRSMTSAPNYLDTQMIGLSRIDYRNMPNKFANGVITQWFYDPRGGANATGRIFLWPTPSDVTSTVSFTWLRPIQDFLSAANSPDMPQEWLDALVWNLAYRMAPEYDCPPAQYSMVKEQAAMTLQNAMGFDREPESYFFGFNADQT